LINFKYFSENIS